MADVASGGLGLGTVSPVEIRPRQGDELELDFCFKLGFSEDGVREIRVLLRGERGTSVHNPPLLPPGMMLAQAASVHT
jgi:hypothetical protein